MEQSIHIYVTSDVHGNVLPLTYGNNEEAELGLAKAAALLKEEKKKHQNCLVMDNGDLIQGTPLTYHYARLDNALPNPMILLLNELEYDGAVIGNHEFNYGFSLLQETVGQSRFPWLSANIVWQQSGEPVFGQPYFIKTFENGVKTAVLGLTTHYIPNWENPEHIEGIQFLDAVETAKKWVPLLKEKADLIIVSYHGGFERDLQTGKPTETLTGENQGYQLCMEVEGIDVLLTGHQHRLIEGLEVNGVAVVQPGTQGTAVGHVEVKIKSENSTWKVFEKKSKLLSTKGYEPDKKIMDLIAPYEEKTQTWLDQPIGFIEGNMEITNPMETRLKDSALIEFINKVQMDAAGADISSTALFDNRSKGFGSHVTMRDIVSNYIYPNTLKVVEITGKNMREALERSASYFVITEDGEVAVNPDFSVPKPQHYNYDMWEGIHYTIDLSKPFGERVIELSYKGKEVGETELYRVVMNNYRAGGGGDYQMFKGKPVIKDLSTDVSELMANYLLKRGKIQATCDDNWKVIVPSSSKK
ncbi:bifunctional metallophosphatase/5'-nucleotidase [Fictibacillus barbaricus]|uniref:2',3'-cyclic-nucleotide 2'-phosphodiesterase/3'-nucleotidase n=1 Tax=Fictibacillus barbaricus TaxID=182136 RepID=A0ABU1U374_9BACL|nr:bifunctional UDP-sugar hydrolase/5'-nucleotidase [Fictibacillus barbaricus]MDR7073931.1 2',3'-cyclic-nucleotide 2'-phosphodiesterase/3'-nucleotidase [Fictibacillus barbaricus]